MQHQIEEAVALACKKQKHIKQEYSLDTKLNRKHRITEKSSTVSDKKSFRSSPRPPSQLAPLTAKRKSKQKDHIQPDRNWLALKDKLNLVKTSKETRIFRRNIRTLETNTGQRDETILDSYPKGAISSLKNTQANQKAIVQNMESLMSVASPVEPNPTKVVALDCEFVGVGKLGKENSLARVSIVNFKGEVLYDKYVRNDKEEVVDYRTQVSGVLPSHLIGSNAVSFEEAQQKTYSIIKDRILVGHAINHDLHVLLLSHPKKLIRDTSKWHGLRDGSKKTPSLRKLAYEKLGIRIQQGGHDSVDDARAALMLYKRFVKEWERDLLSRKPSIMKTKKGKGHE
eukprot:jgi/Galph1/4237/GphlegSOOS_G2926.1